MEKVAKGYYTRTLGERLERLVEAEFQGQYRVYYDHKVTNPDSILAQVGRGDQTENLARLDVAIVSIAHDKERLHVISEIEEHKHSPKRLLGDAAAIMMSENIKVDGRDHPLVDVIIMLGLITKKGGRTGPKARRYISRFESAMGEGRGGKRGIRCVVLDAENGVLMVDEVEACIKSLLLEGLSL